MGQNVQPGEYHQSARREGEAAPKAPHFNPWFKVDTALAILTPQRQQGPRRAYRILLRLKPWQLWLPPDQIYQPSQLQMASGATGGRVTEGLEGGLQGTSWTESRDSWLRYAPG